MKSTEAYKATHKSDVITIEMLDGRRQLPAFEKVEVINGTLYGWLANEQRLIAVVGDVTVASCTRWKIVLQKQVPCN